MNVARYDGWVITVRYYLSSLGDVNPNLYEDRLQSEIRQHYPGADIEIVAVSGGMGYPVSIYKPNVSAPHDKDRDAIEQIMGDVFADILKESSI